MKPLVTMIVPYYRQPEMLKRQIATWSTYSERAQKAFRFVVVDDCSPEPAESIQDLAYTYLFTRGLDIQTYRIEKDIPWNRSMARNLGTHVADTDWILHVDTDHVLQASAAESLIDGLEQGYFCPKRWYRFARFRVGAADETRKKDKVDPAAGFVEIHPHIDSYLCTTDAYWRAGGYNEDFSGVLGGGSPFLKEMESANGTPIVTNITLHVYTRHAVPDSSERTLPRDPAAFKRRKAEIMKQHGTLKGRGIKAALRLPWKRVL